MKKVETFFAPAALMPTLVVANHNMNRGFVAFTSILVIAAVALLVVMSITLQAVGEAQSSLDYKKSTETVKAAEGCLEEALYRLRADPTFTSSTFGLGETTCTISATSSLGVYTIDVQAQIISAVSYTRKLQANARRTNYAINLISVSEVE